MNADRSLAKPLVSVAMATYNGAAFLAEQLDSILSQTYSSFELIIVDDCSTDDTRKILERYKQHDERVRVFAHTVNTGYQKAFYSAIEHCTGAYICFCDQDDTWVSNKIESLLGYIGESLLIFSDSELMNEQGEPTGVNLSDTVRMQEPGTPLVNRGFVIGNCVWGHTIMFHRMLLQYAMTEENSHPHDWWFAVVSSHLGKIKYCPQVLNFYRQHARNVTRAVPLKVTRDPRGKHAEFDLQLSRLKSIAAIPLNKDAAFYHTWTRLFLQRKRGFSIALFLFLIDHRAAIFSFKRKGVLTQLVEIRKMCRKVS
jgi:glycosyltransferase involved in cell wall biosynthesis